MVTPNNCDEMAGDGFMNCLG